MGMTYNTTFEGVLRFHVSMTLAEIREVAQYLGMRRSDNAVEWAVIGLKFNKDLTGLEWNGDGSFTSETCKAILWLIHQVRRKFCHFTLVGELIAQGDAPEDRWKVVCDEHSVCRIECPPPGFVVVCPFCHNKFRAVQPEEGKTP